MRFDIPKEERSIIKVLGVGGGGCNAVSHMYRQGIIGVDFAICNTDGQSMELSPVPTRIQLGPHLTEGRGAGSLPEVGKQACIESIDDVRRFVQDGTKMLFITAGMGGGTGTGAAPIIAKASKELDVLTVAIVTIPFKFEGRRRREQAAEGLNELKQNVDSLIIVSNDKLREIHGNLPVSEAFAHADDILTTAAKGIAEIITVPGYVNVDFEDVNTVMRNSGVSIMGTARAEGEGRARTAVHQALNSPLLEENDIRGARHILVNISSGEHEVTMDEIYEITEYVQDEAGQDTDLIWGNCRDESLGKAICVTVIATGFENSGSREPRAIVENVRGPQMVSLDEELASTHAYADFDKSLATLETRIIDLDIVPRPTHVESHGDPHVKMNNNQQSHAKPASAGRADGGPQVPSPERLREQSKRLNNPQAVVELENEPAYVRRKIELDDLPHSSEINISRWSITGDDEPEIRRDNSYLHDNVD